MLRFGRRLRRRVALGSLRQFSEPDFRHTQVSAYPHVLDDLHLRQCYSHRVTSSLAKSMRTTRSVPSGCIFTVM